jgi:Ca-activated chloride channel family protein
MKRLVCALSLVWVAASAHAAWDWGSLWHTADQRAAQLLRHGDARAAAATYADPRHKAYAELLAGDYAGAARDHAAFDDSDAHYNRGNALAHGGDLAGALKAYDAALARDPHNEDARHNRELVERALREQPPPPPQKQDGAKNSQPGKSGNKNGQKNGGANAGKGGANDTAKADQQQGANKASGAGEHAKDGAKSGAQAQQPGQPGQRDQQGSQGKPGSGSPKGASATGADKNGAGQQPTTRPAGQPQPSAQSVAAGSSEPDNKEQAQRDAAAAMGAATGKEQPASVANSTLKNEQRVSQEQWLQRIPDDPGGLLRRKLLIEHMMRQRGVLP